MKFLSCFSRPKVKEPPDREVSHYMHEKMEREYKIKMKEARIEKKRKEKQMKRYHDFTYLCQGYFAKVYKAKDINNNSVAVKKNEY